MYHFGVGPKVVWQWWRRFIPSKKGKFHTEGSKAAHLVASRAGTKALKAKEWSEAECDVKAATAKRLGLRPVRWTAANGGWTPAEVRLLRGKMSDPEVAAKIGRSIHAVRAKRRRLV
jgi:hypothetical protein